MDTLARVINQSILENPILLDNAHNGLNGQRRMCVCVCVDIGNWQLSKREAWTQHLPQLYSNVNKFSLWNKRGEQNGWNKISKLNGQLWPILVELPFTVN